MILAITSAQRLDSRGNPTIQVDVRTKKGTFRAIVPSGASKGDYEAVELRDNDEAAYDGSGVLKAVVKVEKILAPAILNEGFHVATDLGKIDGLMQRIDGTDDKRNMGANATLGISMACARAGAAESGLPLYEFLRNQADLPDSFHPPSLPVPFFNVLNGGAHSGNIMAFQEFMIAPVGAKSMASAIQMGAEVYQTLKSVIKRKFGATAIGVGDEGGFAPPIRHPEEALDLLVEAIERSGHTGKVKVGIDPASQEFCTEEDGKVSYDLGYKDTGNSEVVSPACLAELYRVLLRKYPIMLLEDPFGQDDWPSWTTFNEKCQCELVGDDLLATNIGRIKIAEEKKACNSLLLKINQIGTISEALRAAKYAYDIGWSVFVSHRSGETTDSFIADLAVALGTGHLKSGAPCRGERVAKYNRLMDIEDEVVRNGNRLPYAGVRGWRE